MSMVFCHIACCGMENIRHELIDENNDGVETLARKSQARFQIIQVTSSSEPRMRLD